MRSFRRDGTDCPTNGAKRDDQKRLNEEGDHRNVERARGAPKGNG